MVSVAIPEPQRRLRHRLRTRLTWLGLGTPTPGLWISPDATKATWCAEVVADLGLEDQSFAWAGPIADIGDERALLAQAWDLDDVERRYLRLPRRVREPRGAADGEAFMAQVQMVQAWRRFPFLDPDLPRELLDHDWPGPRAAAAFHDRHRRWDDGRAAGVGGVLGRGRPGAS